MRGRASSALTEVVSFFRFVRCQVGWHRCRRLMGGRTYKCVDCGQIVRR